MKRLLLVSTLLLACKSAPNEWEQTRNAPPSEPCLVEATDRCLVLPDGCPTFEDDGCPEIVIEGAAGCAHDRTQSLLDEIAARMQTQPKLGRVTIHGDPTLASCVASGIEKRGVDPARLATQDGKMPYVYFEITAWDGAACTEQRPAPACD